MFDTIFLCTAPRSGSTFFIRLLHSADLCTRPQTPFYGQAPEVWAEKYGVSLSAGWPSRLLEAVAESSYSSTRPRLLRVQVDSLSAFRGVLAEADPSADSVAARLQKALGRCLFLHLERRDLLARAVSLLIAQQSGLWHRHADGSELERMSAPREPVYDAVKITRQINAFRDLDGVWRDWFAENGITPLAFDYDEITADPAAAVTRVASALGQAPGAFEVPTAKLADARNAE